MGRELPHDRLELGLGLRLRLVLVLVLVDSTCSALLGQSVANARQIKGIGAIRE